MKVIRWAIGCVFTWFAILIAAGIVALFFGLSFELFGIDPDSSGISAVVSGISTVVSIVAIVGSLFWKMWVPGLLKELGLWTVEEREN